MSHHGLATVQVGDPLSPGDQVATRAALRERVNRIVIEEFAASEAELKPDVVSYRALVQVALQQIVDLNTQVERQRKQLDCQREQIRDLNAQLRQLFGMSNASSTEAA